MFRRFLILLVGVIGLTLAFQNCSAPTSKFGSTNSSSNGGVIATTLPVAPSNLSGSPLSSDQVKLTWVDNSDNEGGFRIERASLVAGPFTSTPGSFVLIKTTDADVISFVDTGLSASTTYYYRVSATNNIGNSLPTTQISVKTYDTPTTPPSPPSNLAATATAATIVTLTWNDNSTNESYFKIERSVGGGAFTQIGAASPNVTSYQDINLNPATSYTYQVKATNSKGDSNYTNTATVTTLAAGNTNSYAYVGANILIPNCVSCHGGALTAAGVSYANYNATLQTVSKGNAAGSQLYQVISNGTMPPGAPLSASQKSIIQAWINANAPQ